MAATYSSFMTTRFSPVFNTALFDGPLRIYFSQSYESAALKIYHLLQTQHADLWARLKETSTKSREHIFLIMYPEKKDLQIVFSEKSALVHSQEWEEGLAIGFCQPQDDADFDMQMELITGYIATWIDRSAQYELSN